MKLNINAICDCGCVRGNNEDMVSLGGILLRDEKISTPVSIDDDGYFYLLVADGMGGHDRGEMASSMLMEHLRECFHFGDIDSENFAEEFTREVKYVSIKMNDMARYEQQEKPMGCTLSGIVWLNGHAWLVNAGDSRTYIFRDGLIQQISYDDENPDGALTNCIGGGSETTLAVFEITERLRDDDIVLVCSDGLGDVADDDTLEYWLTNSPRPAEDLLDWAEENGSSDNISIIAAVIGGGDFASAEGPDDDGRFDAWA